MKQEQQAIDAQYEKKRKGAETAQKMCVAIAPITPKALVYLDNRMWFFLINTVPNPP